MAPTPAQQAIAAIDGEEAAKATLSEWSRLVYASPGPDMFEYSATAGATLHAMRGTGYFDVKGDAGAIRAVLERFEAGLAGLDVPLDEELSLGLRDDEVERADQIALGFDIRPDAGQSRLKLYAIFPGDGTSLARHLIHAAGWAEPAWVGRGPAHIVGLDLGSEGLRDIKLYYVLDRGRLSRVFRDPGQLEFVQSVGRTVVFTRCVRRDRESLHLQFDRSDDAEAELRRLARQRAPVAELLELVDGIGSRSGQPMRPRIIAYPWRAGHMGVDSINAYFHPAPPPGD